MSDAMKLVQDIEAALDLTGGLVAVEAMLEELKSKLQASEWDNEAKEIIKAVAYIGIDWGFGKYELEDKFIDMARKLYEADQGIQNPTITPPKEEE